MRQSFPAFRAAFSVALILPFWRCRRSDRSHPSSASKPPSTGRLTHSKPDSTVSNSLLLRCLASCFSYACCRFRSCSRKSATSFGTDTCSPLQTITTLSFICILSAFNGRVHTRAAGTAPKTVDLHGTSCVQGGHNALRGP